LALLNKNSRYPEYKFIYDESQIEKASKQFAEKVNAYR
jgi:hypothetical protein